MGLSILEQSIGCLRNSQGGLMRQIEQTMPRGEYPLRCDHRSAAKMLPFGRTPLQKAKLSE